MNKPTPKIYRTTNWSSYNRALINRGNISIWFDSSTQWYAQPQSKHGRNQTYSDAAIQCCLMIKSLFRLSLRMVTGFVQSLIKLCGLAWKAPNISDIRIPPFAEDKSILILRFAIKKVAISYANGVSFILLYMLKPFKYVLYSSPQMMSVILSIKMVLMT